VDSTGQRVVFDMSRDSYSKDIARARTFGFTKDVEMLRANGLALGGGLDNAIVMDDYKVLNADVACVTTTNLSSTKSWMPWATCTCWANRCWRATARSAPATT
jgi:hypothetical protein